MTRAVDVHASLRDHGEIECCTAQGAEGVRHETVLDAFIWIACEADERRCLLGDGRERAIGPPFDRCAR